MAAVRYILEDAEEGAACGEVRVPLGQDVAGGEEGLCEAGEGEEVELREAE